MTDMNETPREFLRAFLTACANGINPVEAFTPADLERFTQVELLLEFVTVAMGLASVAGVATDQTDHDVLTTVYSLIDQYERGAG